MRVKCGRHTNELKLYDKDGNEMDLLIAEATIEFKPNSPTVLKADIYIDGVDVEVGEFLTTERIKTHPSSPHFKEGLEAFEAGSTHDENPYYPGKNLSEFLHWNSGWLHGRAIQETSE